MKIIRLFLFAIISLLAYSCVEEPVNPRGDGDDDDDPIVIGGGGTGGGGSGSGSGGGGGFM